MWARNYNRCVVCGETTSKHSGKGKCKRCVDKMYQLKNKEKFRAYNRDYYIAKVKGTPRNKLAREARNYDGKRDVVLERDNWTCKECGSHKSLVVHHVDGSGRGKKKHNNVLKNLVTLCRQCHARLHSTCDWARNYDCCQLCGTTERKHNAKGLCWKCYLSR